MDAINILIFLALCTFIGVNLVRLGLAFWQQLA